MLADCRPETCDVSPDPSVAVFKIKFDFGTSGAREYELGAESGTLLQALAPATRLTAVVEVDMLAWMKAITDANYDMLRIAVEDVRQRVLDARAKADARKSVSTRVTYSTRHDSSGPSSDPAAAAAAIRTKMAVEAAPPATPVPYKPDSAIQQQASAALDALGAGAPPPQAPPRRSSPNGSAVPSPRVIPRHTSSPNLRKAQSVRSPQLVSRLVEEQSASKPSSASPKGRRARSTSTPRFRLEANKSGEA